AAVSAGSGRCARQCLAGAATSGSWVLRRFPSWPRPRGPFTLPPQPWLRAKGPGRRAAGLLAGGVLLRRAGEVGAGVEDGTHPAPRLFSLGRDVLGRPVSLWRAIAPEHPAGHGGVVYLVDAVGDAHGGRRRVHGLDGREVGGAERAQD